MIDIGKELKELRLVKGLSLKEISEITRINLKYLEYLEENNFTFLPEVYVKAFLKNYVRALDQDERKFLSALDEILHPTESKIAEPKEQKTEPIEPEIESDKLPIKKFLIGKTNILTVRNISFLIVAAVIFIFLIYFLIKQDKREEKQIAKTASEKMFDEIQEKSGNFNNIALSDSLVLGITAKDSVWIQVKMDDSVVQEIYLRNGEQKRFKAKNDFYLLVGNAGAINLHLNETELPFTGVKGSVRRLKIDKNGIQLIQVKNEPKKQ